MLHITSWLHIPLYLLVPIYFMVWKEFWVICRTPEVGSTAEPGMLPAFSLADRTEQQWRAPRITWCSSAIQVITSLKEPLSQLYSFPWNLQCTFWGPKIVIFSNHHIKSFKEGIKAEEKAKCAYACPKPRAERQNQDKLLLCSVSNLPWVGPEPGQSVQSLTSLLKKWIEKQSGRKGSERVSRNSHTHIENGLQAHFTKHFSANNACH